jgi:hypothetical protein
MSERGQLHAGVFAWRWLASFHLVILPRKMPASASGVNFNSALNALNVVRGHHAAQHGREVEDLELGDLAHLFGRHGHVGGAEIHGALGELADTTAGADRLIVNLHVGVGGMVFLKPLLINGRRERGARCVDGLGRIRGGKDCGKRGDYCRNQELWFA